MDYRSVMMIATRPVGDLLRDWRQRRRLSQLDLAMEADVSARHVSFLETGRARPSREMLLRLADPLDIPLRERNELLVAAGFAPVYPERGLDAPALRAAREAVERVLRGHEPYPALAVDRHWTMLAANDAVAPLLVGVAKDLVRPPINVLRLSLHPKGLAPRIANYGQWRGHLLERLRGQVAVSADPVLVALLEELAGYPAPDGLDEAGDADADRELAGIVVPLRLRTDLGMLSFISTTTVFGTPLDVTLADLAIESFFPADAETGEVLRGLAGV
ncbi:MAG TPA: helix-turn-helix transcriptional regulator [Thermomicrobiales bacterium]